MELLSIASLIEQLNKAGDDRKLEGGEQLRTACQTLADELLALEAIYCADANVNASQDDQEPPFSVLEVGDKGAASDASWSPGARLRLQLRLPLDLPTSSSSSSSLSPASAPGSLRLCITLPPRYPASASPPQLQLLDRFLGPHEVDTALFSSILKLFLGESSEAVVEWTPEDATQAVLFEGCEAVKAKVESWYGVKEREAESRRRAGERGVPDEKKSSDGQVAGQEQEQQLPLDQKPTNGSSSSSRGVDAELQRLLKTKQWTTTEAIVDRKSTFIGHAIKLDRPEEVPHLLARLEEQNPRMSKATHPLMRAWVCTVGDEGSTTSRGTSSRVVHRDCDDDGETAAGGRMAHLLEALHCENALVVVSRWYGGIQLGADRFKVSSGIHSDGDSVHTEHILGSWIQGSH